MSAISNGILDVAVTASLTTAELQLYSYKIKGSINSRTSVLRYYEVEVSFEGADDLLNLYKNCTKNPEHLNFIPIKEFNIGHLPTDYQDPDIVDMVKVLSDLTVCLAVTRTSPNRPRTFPNSDERYPSYELRGREVLRTGTGWVQGVWRYTNQNCWCSQCKTSSSPHTNWGYIVVNSATHLVFDEEESKNTKLHLFYDNEEDRGARMTLSEAQNGLFEVNEDRCVMTFPTHDIALLERLEGLCENRYQLQRKVRDKYVYPDWLKSYRKRQAVALYNMAVHLSATAIFCLIVMHREILNLSMTATADLLILIAAVVAMPLLVRPLTYIYAHVAFLFSFHAYYKPRGITNVMKYILNCTYIMLLVIVSGRRTLPILEGINTPMYYSLTVLACIIVLTFLDGGVFAILPRFVGAFSILFFMIYLHFKRIIRFPPKTLTSLGNLLSNCWPMVLEKQESESSSQRHKLVIVVSHPHGCSKQVTLGEWAVRECTRLNCYSKYSYTASTCPGSSGALVYILGDTSGPLWMFCNHAHSRSCAEVGLNMCGFGIDD